MALIPTRDFMPDVRKGTSFTTQPIEANPCVIPTYMCTIDITWIGCWDVECFTLWFKTECIHLFVKAKKVSHQPCQTLIMLGKEWGGGGGGGGRVNTLS